MINTGIDGIPTGENKRSTNPKIPKCLLCLCMVYPVHGIIESVPGFQQFCTHNCNQTYFRHALILCRKWDMIISNISQAKQRGNTMSNINKAGNVERQYSDDKNLSARIKLHSKHSTNKQGFSNWLWEHYDFFDNCNILELGCGTGEQWKTKTDVIPKGCKITLSDFSEGMINTVKEAFAEHSAFSFKQIDIQNIPLSEGTFDIVIANHMLYHVSNLSKGLSEVKRVMKTGGKFYSSTISNEGMQPFLHEAFKRFHPDTTAFTQNFLFNLQNGYEILNAHFNNVKRVDYEDSLAITETQDLIDWIKSTITLSSYIEQSLDDLFNYFEDIRKKEGAINIPKENGLFISIK